MKKFKSLILFLVFLMFATIVLSNKVFASEDVFDKLLTDGKLVVHSVKPTDDGTAWTVVYENTVMQIDEDNYYMKWGRI